MSLSPLFAITVVKKPSDVYFQLTLRIKKSFALENETEVFLDNFCPQLYWLNY